MYSPDVRPPKLTTSNKLTIAGMLVVAVVVMVLLILFTASDKWTPV
jgi:hypothetical protein